MPLCSSSTIAGSPSVPSPLPVQTRAHPANANLSLDCPQVGEEGLVTSLEWLCYGCGHRSIIEDGDHGRGSNRVVQGDKRKKDLNQV